MCSAKLPALRHLRRGAVRVSQQQVLDRVCVLPLRFRLGPLHKQLPVLRRLLLDRRGLLPVRLLLRQWRVPVPQLLLLDGPGLLPGRRVLQQRRVSVPQLLLLDGPGVLPRRRGLCGGNRMPMQRRVLLDGAGLLPPQRRVDWKRLLVQLGFLLERQCLPSRVSFCSSRQNDGPAHSERDFEPPGAQGEVIKSWIRKGPVGGGV